MRALSIFSKYPNRLEVLFFSLIAFSVPAYYVGYEFASTNPYLATCGVLTFIASVRMALHCLAYPKPGEGNFFIPLQRWWYRNCRKLGIDHIEGRWYYTSLCDIRTWVLYDQEGYLAGWHQEDYYEGYMVFVPASTRHGDKRIHSLSWFSRWRSGKLPKSKYAEVISDGGTIVGHTTYTD